MWLCCSRSTFFLVCFSFSFLSISLQSVDRQVTVDCMDMADGALQPFCAKAGHCVFGHPRCQLCTSTVMPFELLLYHKLIFAFFGFAVCSSCQNRSLFLCIVSFNVTNHRRTQDSSKNILNLLLQQFSVLSGEGKGGLSVSFAIFFSLTNKRSFLRVFPEDILVSSDCEVFTVFIFYQGWS